MAVDRYINCPECEEEVDRFELRFEPCPHCGFDPADLVSADVDGNPSYT